MHARVSTYEGDAEELVRAFDSVAGPLDEIDGFRKAYFLVDRSGGRAISITLWDSEEALEASVQRANELREEASSSAGASIASVDHYEVALEID
jgi:heme-degrading monooxygenase HmoA